jgi:hypothetical protein
MVPIMPPVFRHIARSSRPSAQQGASRTGLASAVILALLLDSSIPIATPIFSCDQPNTWQFGKGI